jgi:hypothetical protein
MHLIRASLTLHHIEVPRFSVDSGATGGSLDARAKLAIERDGLQRIIDALARHGNQVIGPTVRDGAIVYDAIARLDELPVGWTDQQDGGQYRLERRDDAALFGYAVGRIPGSGFYIRRLSASGKRAPKVMVSR